MKKSHLTLVLLLILFGAANTIFLSLQNHQEVPDLKPNNKFFHPFIQTAIMFIGESLVFIPYLIYIACKPKRNFLQMSGFMKMPCPNYLPLIPAIMDLLSSLLAYISLNLIAGSVWQISRGGVIITTAIFSRIFLSKKLTKSAVLGCSMAFIGITLVQLFEIIFSQGSSESQHSVTEQIIGVVLLLASLIFNTAVLIIEKIIFNKYTIHPLKMVYLQGFYGLIGMSVIILVLNFVTCPDIGSIKDKCILYNGSYFIENLPVFIDQITRNWALFMYVVGLAFSIGISVPIAVTISKVINPISRSLADVCRTVIIWGFCLLLTVTVGKENKYYILEKTDVKLNLLKLIGFVLVILGTMIYHDIIKVFKENADDIKDSLLLDQEGDKVQRYTNGSSSSPEKSSSSKGKKEEGQPTRESLI